MTPRLKAPENKRLILNSDELLSSFAFNFELRRYKLNNRIRQITPHGEVITIAESSRSVHFDRMLTLV
jgi:hypothetical protein